MADLNSLGDFSTAASQRDGMLEVGITQASQTASTQQARADASAKRTATLDGTPLGSTASKLNGNPLAIGPVAAPAYVQPDSGPRTPNGATVIVENVKNPLKITGPLPVNTQPGVSAPVAPVANQLSALSYGSIGVSKITKADGTVVST